MIGRSLRRNRQVLGPVLRGVASGALRRRAELRHHVVRDVWTLAKRFGAPAVENVELREIPCLRDAVAEGYVDDPQRVLLSALGRGLGAASFFEIGTSHGRTAWTLARNDPSLEVYTLDVPLDRSADATALPLAPDDARFFRPADACGIAFRDTPEAARITQLWGDSATFDFSPFHGRMDLVYVDGAHTYEYVSSDTERALAMLSPRGTIAWDDYTINPGVYACVNEVARTLDRPVYHLFGTRMALYSRQDFVVRIPPDDFSSTPSL
ncbi:MAG TPA: class I SAM-dependent methyltransferase [Solirubrobacteraceae bacterium]|nr:class I SAM-dependent methyltransferase [Solirubrobacteraceae bacterium]